MIYKVVCIHTVMLHLNLTLEKVNILIPDIIQKLRKTQKFNFLEI